MPKAIYLSHNTLSEEIRSFAVIASEFLEPTNAGWLLGNLHEQLNGAKLRAPGYTTAWAISERYPLATIVSHGEYEPLGRKGGKVLHGELVFKWELKRIDSTTHEFQLENASSIVKLIHTDEVAGRVRKRIVGQWRFEIAVATSPGTYFHTSVDGNVRWFPPDIPIPRLHAFPLSPFASLEYLIGELFQYRWAASVTARNDEMMVTWRRIQQMRFEAYLDAMRTEIARGVATPLSLLKSWKPLQSTMLDV